MSFNTARRVVFTFVSSVAFLLLFTGGKARENQILVSNSVANTVTLWVWDDQKSNWRRPPMRVHRGGSDYLKLPPNGSVYLVARDSEDRDFHLGRFNFHELMKQTPDGKLDLSCCSACSAMEETRSYICPRCGQIHYYTVPRKAPHPSIRGDWTAKSPSPSP